MNPFPFQLPARHKIAYVMSRFPHLPETFILREMVELERQGWEVALYPLIVQRQPVVHTEAQAWLPRVRTVAPFSPGALAENGRRLAQTPFCYLSAGWQTVKENLSSPKFLARAAYLFPKAVEMARRMQREGIEHIHAHYATHPALAAWLISRLTGISYSVTVHAHDIFVDSPMLATKLREAAFVAAISEFNRQWLTQRLGDWVAQKTHIVHCGVSPQYYQPRPERLLGKATARRTGGFEIMNIGSLQPYKGQRFLIEAVAELLRRGIPVHCRIIGGGEEQSRLEKLIQQHRLEAHVELLGPRTQQEVARLLPEVDCYVQPSVITASGKMEGIPVALMEAMACAVPCIASRLSGIPELVRPGETGWLVPAGDVQALADCIESVYAHPDAAAGVALEGRKWVLEQFELSANVRKLSDLFRKVLDSVSISAHRSFRIRDSCDTGVVAEVDLRV